jgi:hypothetical protein
MFKLLAVFQPIPHFDFILAISEETTSVAIADAVVRVVDILLELIPVEEAPVVGKDNLFEVRAAFIVPVSVEVAIWLIGSFGIKSLKSWGETHFCLN